MPKKYEQDLDRVLSHIEVNEDGCWIWQMSRDNHGYGMVRAGYNSKSMKAHRYSYSLFVGEIPAGKSICHTCDVRACVNPEHLWIGTAADNMRDASQKKRLGGTKPRLTMEQREQLKQLEGVTKKEAADMFGVSQSTIQKYWKEDSNNA